MRLITYALVAACSVAACGCEDRALVEQAPSPPARNEPWPNDDAGRASVPTDDDAGLGASLAVPSCSETNGWLLADGLRPNTPVDYLADRDDERDDRTLSETGHPCANARERASCEGDLLRDTRFGRHLVTTHVDGARFWPNQSGLRLLTPIDSAAEAIWRLISLDFVVPCDASLHAEGDSFVAHGVISAVPRCVRRNLLDGGTSPPGKIDARISPEGAVSYVPEDGIDCSRF